ncbi:MAG: RnfABCDGE type electron transport complex subunit A [Planctomycetes bacterium]|nr:RnfABCDGE type electron transport complex subunit A [Planctomycetota bacterium]
MEYVVLIVSAVLVNNIVLAQYLGNCPFCGVSRDVKTSLGMGAAVAFVLTFASAITWLVHHYCLVPMNLAYLQTVVFILVIATLVQLVELFLRKSVRVLYHALGVFLPLITTNCAVLGVAILCIRKKFDFTHTVVFSFASAVGFMLAIVLMAGIRRRFPISPIPRPLRGTAITLITAGLMALAFFGFLGVDASLTALTK